MNNSSAPAGPWQRSWHFFTSVKLTVAILLCIAAASIIGTLIPQNENPSFYFHQYGRFLYALFSLLDIFDMYHSWWFLLLLAVLMLNIIACSVHRLSASWKTIFTRHPSYPLSRFRKAKNRVGWAVDKPSEELTQHYMKIIGKKFSRRQLNKTADGFLIFAEKQRWTRLGAYVVHASILFLLIGGVIGSLFGFEGFATIAEGQSVDHILLNKSQRVLPLGFEIRCDDFEVRFYESGAPQEYRSRVTLIENNKPVLSQDILVNKPLHFRGVSIYQSSYGEMPAQSLPAADLQTKKIILNIANRSTGMTYSKELFVGDAIELPEGMGKFVIKEYRPSAVFRGQDIGEALICDLIAPEQDPVEVLLPLRFPNFDKMRNGYFIFSLENTDDLLQKEGAKPKYYTGLQVAKDPGVGLVYFGFVLMIAGCYISFFMAHQQVCIEVGRSGQKTRVFLAGTTNKNRMQMEIYLKKLSNALSAGEMIRPAAEKKPDKEPDSEPYSEPYSEKDTP
jgi:cytochrome c biogenesis protein